MNDIPETIVDPVSGDHFILTLDPATGETVKVKLLPTGEFSQDLDDYEINAFESASAHDEAEGVTIH
jgi:hypothetical protein